MVCNKRSYTKFSYVKAYSSYGSIPKFGNKLVLRAGKEPANNRAASIVVTKVREDTCPVDKISLVSAFLDI